jgi:hypothetical protein
MEVFVESALDLDEEGVTAERAPGAATAIIGDKDIRLLLRDNRIALARESARKVPTDGGPVAYDVPLICVVHSHPKCRFEWSRVLVDVTPTPDAIIADMSPREVMDANPVELQTTVGAGLKFTIAGGLVGAELSPQLAKSRTVYYPRIVSSGAGFTRGYWDFLALGDQYLHANRELRVLIQVPREAAVFARFQLRARVELTGVAGRIPLLARGGEIESVHRLDT